MNYVVGSGPAGISCATALLRQGHRVTLLDAGVRMEPERRAIVAELSGSAPTAWKPAHLDALRRGLSVAGSRVPDKRAYGSDFTFQDVERYLPMTSRGTDVRPSLAAGGLSNVWGAAILPYRAADLAGWPIGIADLESHYDAVTSWMPTSAGSDDGLSTEYRLHAPTPDALRPSRQAADLLRHLEAHAEALHRDGYRFGRSRLAVRAVPSPQGPGCVYCGLCLYGCPYGLIYNAADTLDTLRSHPQFSYEADVVVRRVHESGTRVLIDAESRTDGAPRQFEGGRAYLAGGVLGTTRIVLESMEAYDRPVLVRDSQYFLLPLMSRRRARAIDEEPLHTLAQAFIEIDNPRVSRYNVHLQVYTYNDWFDRAVGLSWLPSRLREEAIGRLLVVQGYLHSDESTPITMRVQRPAADRPAQVTLESVRSAATTRAVKRVAGSLVRHARALGAIALTPLLQICAAGRGYHCGGTLPMRARPGPYETDTLGRPRGFARVHVVDASSFPTIPAGPITLSVMANAHRIGSADLSS